MSVTTVTAPSPVKAVVYLLRGDGEGIHPDQQALIDALHTLAPTNRIDESFQTAWVKSDRGGSVYNSIWVQRDGGIGADPQNHRAQARLYIRCYSNAWHIANEMAMLAAQILCPVDPSHQQFRAASTTVYDVKTSDPDDVEEENTGRRYMGFYANVIYDRRTIVTVSP